MWVVIVRSNAGDNYVYGPFDNQSECEKFVQINVQGFPFEIKKIIKQSTAVMFGLFFSL